MTTLGGKTLLGESATDPMTNLFLASRISRKCLRQLGIKSQPCPSCGCALVATGMELIWRRLTYIFEQAVEEYGLKSLGPMERHIQNRPEILSVDFFLVQSMEFVGVDTKAIALFDDAYQLIDIGEGCLIDSSIYHELTVTEDENGVMELW